jgi:hypothetical protein
VKVNRGQRHTSEVLQRATPYPWGRDDHGNLIGANGHAIYFMGADAVLVEYAPVMLEHLRSIREQATITASQSAGDRLSAIWRLADTLISGVERTYASPEVRAVPRATGRHERNSTTP